MNQDRTPDQELEAAERDVGLSLRFRRRSIRRLSKAEWEQIRREYREALASGWTDGYPARG